MTHSFPRGRALPAAFIGLIAVSVPVTVMVAPPAHAVVQAAAGPTTETLTGPPAARPADPSPVRAGWPLEPRPAVVRGFEPPPLPWSPGHRGVDLAGSPGQPVLAAMAGTVTYAGVVAGRGVVVVSHGSVRTTYEPVIAAVRAGATVAGGEALGRLSAAGSHCAPTACLHWGLRTGDEYRDPLTLVGSRPVRLLPSNSSPLTRPDSATPADSAGRSRVVEVPAVPAAADDLVRSHQGTGRGAAAASGRARPAGSLTASALATPLSPPGRPSWPRSTPAGDPRGGLTSGAVSDAAQRGHASGRRPDAGLAPGLVVGLAAVVTVGGGLLVKRH